MHSTSVELGAQYDPAEHGLVMIGKSFLSAALFVQKYTENVKMIPANPLIPSNAAN